MSLTHVKAVCSSCVGKITNDLKMSINNVLSDNEISDGLTLACGNPNIKNISIDFDDV